MNGAVPKSFAGLPVALTAVELPPALNAKPSATLAANVHVPEIAPELTEQVARLESPGSDRVTEVSLREKLDPDNVTEVPLGPCVGLSVIGGSPPFARTRMEELGAAEEGVGEGDEPTVILAPPTDTE